MPDLSFFRAHIPIIWVLSFQNLYIWLDIKKDQMGINLKSIFQADNLDDKSLGALTQALQKQGLAGFDYIEFKQALANLRSMNLDDATAFKSAFATASTMGLTKEKLLKTADFYKTVLSKEKGKFNQALQAQIESKINNKGTQLEKLKQGIISHQEKIKKLESEIEQYQNKIDNADDEILATKSKLDLANTNFDTAYNSVLEQINSDIEHITNLL